MLAVIRLHLDENVSRAVADGLRRRGVDVTTTADAGLIGASDLDQIAFALRESRGIFTQDHDFLAHHQAGVKHAGIIYAPKGTRSIGEIVRFLVLVNTCLDQRDMVGRLEYA